MGTYHALFSSVERVYVGSVGSQLRVKLGLAYEPTRASIMRRQWWLGRELALRSDLKRVLAVQPFVSLAFALAAFQSTTNSVTFGPCWRLASISYILRFSATSLGAPGL